MPPYTLEMSYDKYYCTQAGSGISGFQGIRYQKGTGIFGNFLRTIGLPILKYLGRQALETGVDIGQDIISGSKVKDAAKSNLRKRASKVLVDANDRAQALLSGSGMKRRRITRKGKKSIKRRKSENKKKPTGKTRMKKKAQIKKGNKQKSKVVKKKKKNKKRIVSRRVVTLFD